MEPDGLATIVLDAVEVRPPARGAHNARNAMLALAAVFGLLPARADINDQIERITNFRKDIVVARDGTMDVRETITVNAQGDFSTRVAARPFRAVNYPPRAVPRTALSPGSL